MNKINMPFSDAFEKGVLGYIINNSENIFGFINDLKQDYFFEEKNNKLFNILIKMLESTEDINFSIIKDKTKDILPTNYILDVIDSGVIINIDYYIQSLRDFYLQRNILKLIQDTNNKYLIKELDDEKEINGELLFNFVEDSLYDIMRDNDKKTFYTIDKVSIDIITEIENFVKDENNFLGHRTGYIELDKSIGGIQDTNLVIIAGATSMGKTAFALNIIRNMIIENKKVLLFSYEMNEKELTKRMLSLDLNYNITNLNNFRGKYKDAEYAIKGIMKAQKQYKKNLIIDTNASKTISRIKTTIKEMDMKFGIDVIVIDYLQLIGTENTNKNKTREREVAEISRELKTFAQKINKPIIALSQLSREIKKRENFKPDISDLRDSGALEQDCNLVLLLYRKEYYEKNKNENNFETLKQDYEESTIIIGKNRNGERGKEIKLKFIPKLMKFEDWQNERIY